MTSKLVVVSVQRSNLLGKELLVAIKEGDECAFELFYRMERNNLVHFIGSYAIDRQQAEDIAQESLLKIWETKEHLNVDGNIRALTFTIARNKALDFLRAKTDMESLDACAYLEDESLDAQINALDLARLIEKTFDKLPEKTRNTFLMSRREGLSNSEIARKERVSVKAVEYRISQALKNFKKIKESF